MALKINMDIDVPLAGLVNLDAYVKVEKVITTSTHADAFVKSRKDDAEGHVVREWSMSFVPDMDGPNCIRQAYLNLKSRPEFAGATDC